MGNGYYRDYELGEKTPASKFMILFVAGFFVVFFILLAVMSNSVINSVDSNGSNEAVPQKTVTLTNEMLEADYKAIIGVTTPDIIMSAVFGCLWIGCVVFIIVMIVKTVKGIRSGEDKILIVKRIIGIVVPAFALPMLTIAVIFDFIPLIIGLLDGGPYHLEKVEIVRTEVKSVGNEGSDRYFAYTGSGDRMRLSDKQYRQITDGKVYYVGRTEKNTIIKFYDTDHYVPANDVEIIK